jgi:hypothetical protein
VAFPVAILMTAPPTCETWVPSGGCTTPRPLLRGLLGRGELIRSLDVRDGDPPAGPRRWEEVMDALASSRDVLTDDVPRRHAHEWPVVPRRRVVVSPWLKHQAGVIGKAS